MQYCNELIINSVNFLFKILNIVIIFEQVYLTKNDWKPFKKITDNKLKKKNKSKTQKRGKRKKTICIEMYNDQTQTHILYYMKVICTVFLTQREELWYIGNLVSKILGFLAIIKEAGFLSEYCGF